MKAPTLSQAETIAQVNRQRKAQDSIQDSQRLQMADAERIANAISDLRGMGTTDTDRAVANQVDETMINAQNLSRTTEERAMVVVIGQTADATTAGDHARSAQHNAHVFSTVGQEMNRVMSGQQAQAVQVSIVREGELQANVRDTSTQNANELRAHTREAIEFTDTVKNRVHNILLPD